MLQFVLHLCLVTAEVTHQAHPSLGKHQTPSWREVADGNSGYSYTVWHLPSMKHPEASFLVLPQRSPVLEWSTERWAKELPQVSSWRRSGVSDPTARRSRSGEREPPVSWLVLTRLSSMDSFRRW